mmetsp:Transcript_39386/g.111616  ORF Transcript_39386/g.111616 Transcript_39386/m.111616 type:complete len:386 (-) Transcript_39386:382-1539(-)
MSMTPARPLRSPATLEHHCSRAASGSAISQNRSCSVLRTSPIVRHTSEVTRTCCGLRTAKVSAATMWRSPSRGCRDPMPPMWRFRKTEISLADASHHWGPSVPRTAAWVAALQSTCKFLTICCTSGSAMAAGTATSASNARESSAAMAAPPSSSAIPGSQTATRKRVSKRASASGPQTARFSARLWLPLNAPRIFCRAARVAIECPPPWPDAASSRSVLVKEARTPGYTGSSSTCSSCALAHSTWPVSRPGWLGDTASNCSREVDRTRSAPGRVSGAPRLASSWLRKSGCLCGQSSLATLALTVASLLATKGGRRGVKCSRKCSRTSRRPAFSSSGRLSQPRRSASSSSEAANQVRYGSEGPEGLEDSRWSTYTASLQVSSRNLN